MQWNVVCGYWQSIRSATSQLPDLRGTLVGWALRFADGSFLAQRSSECLGRDDI